MYIDIYINIDASMILTKTLIEIIYPARQSIISFILEYFDQQRMRTKKYKAITVPFGSLVFKGIYNNEE
jgi:hypothetical protein